jgi:hypothetical protein
MRFEPDTISLIITITIALPAVIATPLPTLYRLSTFNRALEPTARFITDAAEKRFSSGKIARPIDYAMLSSCYTNKEAVPNSLGNGEAIGVLNIQLGPKSEGVDIHWQRDEVLSVDKIYSEY